MRLFFFQNNLTSTLIPLIWYLDNVMCRFVFLFCVLLCLNSDKKKGITAFQSAGMDNITFYC